MEEKITTKELLNAYKVISKIMNEKGFTHDTSFRRVQTWLSTAICDNIEYDNMKNALNF